MFLSHWLVMIGVLGLPSVALGQVTDYSAGKSPAQLFATDCAACHQTARGLAKGRDQRSLSGFLREHYTTKQETATTLAAFLAGAPAGPASETRNPGAPGGRQQQATRPPRPPAAVDPGGDDTAIVAPEPGAKPNPQRARPAREAAKPPPASQRGKKPDTAADEAEKEALRAKVRGYATVGDEARPKVSAPAAAPPPPAAGDTSARPPAEPAAPAGKPNEPARSDAPAAPAPSGEERRSPPG
jgi:hypothetical protein